MFERVYRWRGAMAQYDGTPARWRASKSTAGYPRGWSSRQRYRGIGVPDCIREGTDAANAVVQMLSLAATSPSLT
jgi:protoporphyrinogen oxidase